MISPFSCSRSQSAILAISLSLTLHSIASADESAPVKSNAPPSFVDLRPEFTELGLRQRQQGARGTCSVFTMVGALEFAAARARGHGEMFSIDFLNWAANQHRPPADGGFFSDMWKGFADYGICTEEQMPYAAKFYPNRKPDDAAVTVAKTRLESGLTRHWIKEWNVKTGLTDEQFVAIKRTLGQGWPVCGGFRWPKRPQWKNEILQMCAAEDVFDGHSVLIVGYRDDPAADGGGTLIFRNSNRGSDGFMPYAYAEAYMNDALWISTSLKPGAPDNSPSISKDASPPQGE
jgi:C1A family cysteine protease